MENNLVSLNRVFLNLNNPAAQHTLVLTEGDILRGLVKDIDANGTVRVLIQGHLIEALASVLVLNPQVLIFDEPTNGLDPRTQSWLVSVLLKLNEQGRTLIIATHNLELAHTLCPRSLLLSEQHQIIFDGPTDHILNDHEMLREANLIADFYHTHHNQMHTHRYTHQ
jgi:ABC-type cobalamin/Fe3+-siderophores transport system ATPase subunit